MEFLFESLLIIQIKTPLSRNRTSDLRITTNRLQSSALPIELSAVNHTAITVRDNNIHILTHLFIFILMYYTGGRIV